MTKIDIAALVADREAGTKGPWFAESGHVQQNGQLYWQVTDGSDAIVQNQFCWCRGNHDANARRIARVPDMEDALIAQDSELRRLQAELASLTASRADAGAVMVEADWKARAEALQEALTLIERVYYLEEKDAAWKIARMNGIAREAQDGNDLGHYRRIFPRAAAKEPRHE